MRRNKAAVFYNTESDNPFPIHSHAKSFPLCSVSCDCNQTQAFFIKWKFSEQIKYMHTIHPWRDRRLVKSTFATFLSGESFFFYFFTQDLIFQPFSFSELDMTLHYQLSRVSVNCTYNIHTHTADTTVLRHPCKPDWFPVPYVASYTSSITNWCTHIYFISLSFILQAT